MTDSLQIFSYLHSHEGQWVYGPAMSAELKPGCVSWAYRSRISDLNLGKCADDLKERMKGYRIESRKDAGKCWWYRMVIDSEIEPALIDVGGQLVWKEAV